MIRILPGVKDMYQYKGISLVYGTMIQHQISSRLRETTAECLSTMKGWIAGDDIAPDLEYQIQVNNTTKILKLNADGQLIRVHCVCRYGWKSTVDWQFSKRTEPDIWLLRKHIKANCDYVAILNRGFNQLILIPRSEIDAAEQPTVPILNKLNGKSKDETIAVIPYVDNPNIEFFVRGYENPNSLWAPRQA